MSAEIALRQRLGGFQLDAAFRFHAPGVTALFGPSGAGKSTIIAATAGLTRPEAGRIVVDGETLLDTERGIFVSAPARRLGVVFQDARLFPHMNVAANLFYGWRRAPARAMRAETDAIIAMLGLEALLARRPKTLSGGERSRVALGRALLMRPRALLLDEPLAALDAARKAEILPYLERVAREAKIPILYVSHAIDEVARLADRIIVLKEGRVLAEGPLFDISARLDLVTGAHVFAGAILSATVAAQDEAYGLSELTLDGQRLIVPRVPHAPGDKVRIRIDAQDVMLALVRPEGVSANNILAVTVAGIGSGEGPSADVQLGLGEARLVARITRRSLDRLKLAPGMAVFAVIKSVTVGRSEHG